MEQNNSSEVKDIKIEFWDRRLQKSGGSGLWFSQLKSLLRKNYILSKRSWKTTLFITVIVPLLSMCLMLLIGIEAIDFNRKDELHPEKKLLEGVPDCMGNSDDYNKCINLMFTNCIDEEICERNSEVDKIMSIFIENNNRRMKLNWSSDSNNWDNWEKDKLNYNITKKFDIIHVPNSNFIYNYTLSHQNTTSYGIVFDIKKDSSVTNYRYQIWYNATNNFNSTATLSRGIDEAIVQISNGDSNIKPQIDISVKDFPYVSQESDIEIYFSKNGPVTFFISVMAIFIHLLSNVTSEKETKIRYSMEMMGLKQSVYWCSWIIYYSILIFLNTVSTIFFGRIFNYSFFKNTDLLVLTYLFFIFGLSFAAFGFFISSLVKRSKTAVLIGIFIIILCYFFIGIFFVNEMTCYIFWSDEISQNYRKFFSYLVPFFNYGKLYVDIAGKSSNTYNYVTLTVIKGKGFKYGDLFDVRDTYVLNSMDLDDLEPPVNAIYYMIFNCLLYLLLAIYFDNIRSNEYGKRKPFYYFLLPSYWNKNRSVINSKEWVTVTKNKYPKKINNDELNDDVRTHFKNTCDPNYEEDAPLKIINLRKVFGRGKKRKVAVKNTCLTIAKNKVVALLGQNGAGKSTTMNIIAGLSQPTSGDILVMNKSILRNPEGVQSELGICPQHDLLINNLTAMEHLYLYSGIKGGINCLALDDILVSRLDAVQLSSVKDSLVKTYSGGMKRRLSMIIATIGDPNVILLDEPTTGMDPVNRRYVWKFIEQFKKGRCVLLTTHSMEEADALGDEIVIMSRSVIKAIGNSIHLKNKFGNGYRISIIVNGEENIDKMKSIANNLVPGIHLVDDSAGALIYDFSYEQSDYISKFVQYLDENPDNYVNNWGMSQTTLEDVFLTVIDEDSKRRIKDKEE